MTDTMNRRDILGAGALGAGAVGAAAVLATAPMMVSDAAAQAPSGRLTVHILDLFSGTPANGAQVELSMKEGSGFKVVKTVTTGPDGRPTTGPLLQGETFAPGRYLVAFDLSDYFKGLDKSLPANFFRKVTMEFEVVDAKIPHHVPLQCTPWTQACSVLPG